MQWLVGCGSYPPPEVACLHFFEKFGSCLPITLEYRSQILREIPFLARSLRDDQINLPKFPNSPIPPIPPNSPNGPGSEVIFFPCETFFCCPPAAASSSRRLLLLPGMISSRILPGIRQISPPASRVGASLRSYATTPPATPPFRHQIPVKVTLESAYSQDIELFVDKRKSFHYLLVATFTAQSIFWLVTCL